MMAQGETRPRGYRAGLLRPATSKVRHPWVVTPSDSTRVLINGFVGDTFRHVRDLRPGVLLSPFLFIVVMYVAILRRAEQDGIFSLFERWGIHHRLSLYVDDAVLLIRTVEEEARAVVDLLHAFGMTSGLRCKLTKSSATSIHCESMDLYPLFSKSSNAL